jgi:hypothetical protein
MLKSCIEGGSLLSMLKDTVLRSPGIRSGFYCPMSSDLAIFYAGYGLPHRVLILGLSPYTIYLQGGSHQYS